MGVARRLFTAALFAGGAVALGARVALAHGDVPLTPRNVWSAWNLQPGTLAALLLLGGIYVLGAGRLWRRAGAGRGVSRLRVAGFAVAWLALGVALLSPLDPLSDALFSAHMVQHLLLMVVAPPLLIWAMPPFVVAWAVPRSWRRPLAHWWHRQVALHRLWRWMTKASTVWALHALALWLWHMPQLYNAALHNEALHIVEHGSFLVAALLFWWTLFGQGTHRLARGAAILFVFTTALHSGLLGAVLTFARRPLYAHHVATTPVWGITALQDQQLAGVIMWFPVGLVYLGAILFILGRWMHETDRREAEMVYTVGSRSVPTPPGTQSGVSESRAS